MACRRRVENQLVSVDNFLKKLDDESLRINFSECQIAKYEMDMFDRNINQTE